MSQISFELIFCLFITAGILTTILQLYLDDVTWRDQSSMNVPNEAIVALICTQVRQLKIVCVFVIFEELL